MKLEDILDQIEVPDEQIARKAQARLDRLTKPVGSLGRLEELAVRYAMIIGEVKPSVPKGVVFTLAADHGIAREGVSAYPQEVTPQMVLNFLRGGAGVNVLARHAGIEVRVVDIGVAYEFGSIPGLIHKKVMAGTNSFLTGAAMSREQAEQAIAIGIQLVADAASQGVGMIGTGEMGIGNTTASTAITAVMTGRSVEDVAGRGTGIDDAGYRHKVSVIKEALAFHHLDPNNALDVLSKVGGLEIAGLVGLILGSALARVPVVLDGFIAGAAALIAVRLQPKCLGYMIASHRSAERGHQVLLDHLGLKPLLDLDLRLGEGTGACLAMNLICAAVKIMTEMATFGEAGVSERRA